MKCLLVLLLVNIAFAQQTAEGAINTDIAISTENQEATVTITSSNEQIVIPAAQVGTNTQFQLQNSIASLPGVPGGYTVVGQYTATYTTTLATPPAFIDATSFRTSSIAAPSSGSRVVLLWNPTTRNWQQIATTTETGAAQLTANPFRLTREGTTARYVANAIVVTADFTSATVGRYYTCTATSTTPTDCALGGGAVAARVATTSGTTEQTVTFIVNDNAPTVPFAAGNVIGKFLGTWVQIVGNSNVVATLIGTETDFTGLFTSPTAGETTTNYPAGGFARFDAQQAANGDIGGYYFREKATTRAIADPNTSATFTTADLTNGLYALIHEYEAGTAVGPVNLNAANTFPAGALTSGEWNGAVDNSAPVRSYQASFAAASQVTVNSDTTNLAAVTGVNYVPDSKPAVITTLAFDPTTAPGTSVAAEMPVMRIAPGSTQNNFIAASATAVSLRAFFCATAGCTPSAVPVSRRPDGTILVRANAAGTYQIGVQESRPAYTVTPNANGDGTFNVLANGLPTNLVLGTSGFQLQNFVCNDGGNTATVSVTGQAASNFANQPLSGFEFLAGNFRQITTTCNQFTTNVIGTYTDEQLGTRQATSLTWARYETATATASTAVASTRDTAAKTVTATGVNNFSFWALAAQPAGSTDSSGTTTDNTNPTAPAVPGTPAVPSAPDAAVMTAPFMALLAVLAAFCF